MQVYHRMGRFAAATSLSVGIVGLTAGGLAATHPAQAASVLAGVESAVTCATTAACVSGSNTAGGPGVAGSSARGNGVSGTSTSGYGMLGTSSSGNAGVAGTTVRKDGVYGYTTSGIGVFGTSTSGYGVSGRSTSSTGTYGISNTGYGVAGEARNSGVGVYAYEPSSSSADGIYAEVHGTGEGVIANLFGSGEGSAISGSNYSPYGIGGYFYGQTGILGISPASASASPLTLSDYNDNMLFYVDGVGNVYYHGALHSFAAIRGGATVNEFTPKSALPTLEDTGTAQLAGGAALVRLEPTFAASIEPGAGYRVFLTPNGDTRGLFVASKTAAGFAVRESQGGRSTVTFDYRIVATAQGQAGQRMAVLSAGALPRVSIPAAKSASRPPSMLLDPSLQP